MSDNVKEPLDPNKGILTSWPGIIDMTAVIRRSSNCPISENQYLYVHASGFEPETFAV